MLQGHQKHYFKDAAGIEIVNIMFALGGENGLLSPKIRNLEGPLEDEANVHDDENAEQSIQDIHGAEAHSRPPCVVMSYNFV